MQNIRSDYFVAPLGPTQAQLPRSFLVLGQKFVPDSWAFSQTVFDSILWVEGGHTNKVPRRVPGALDTAFAIFGNDQAVPELVAQMKGIFQDADRPHALKWRDAKPYQHNLAAARAVMDQQTGTAWDSSIYMEWLAALRDLSAPTTDAKYPEAMRTRPWAMKTLNTQLASWTHLRHDNILYAKQSFSLDGGCVYPAGFVEPRLEFWSHLDHLASRAADQIAALQYSGTYSYTTNRNEALDPATGAIIDPGGLQTNVITLATIQSRQVEHLRNFAATVARLEVLVLKEEAQECFTAEDARFVDGLIEGPGGFGGCKRPSRLYDGWYPSLFYRTVYWTDAADFLMNYSSGAFDALVADVHTDLPCGDCGDPGSVLHEAVGRVNLLMMAVDNGHARFICAGPVLSHYEFEVVGEPRRFSDEEWRAALNNDLPVDVPASRIEGLSPPPWTRSYLAPR